MPEWETARLADIAVGGGLAGGPFGSSLGSKDYVSVGIPVIRGVNLGSDGKFDAQEFVYVMPEKARQELSRNLAEPGDVVFTQRGTLGQVGIVPLSPHEKYVISQSQMRLRVNPERAIADFIYYQFKSPVMIKAIQSLAITTGVPHINLSILRQLNLLLPPVRTQSAISAILGALDDKIAVNGQIAKITEALSKAIGSDERWAGMVPLVEIVHHSKSQVQPGNLVAEFVAHYSIPAFDSTRMPEVVNPGTIKSNKFKVDTAAVLVSKLNPSIPRVWNVDPSPQMPALASTEFLVLQPRPGISAAEIWVVCRQENFMSALAKKVTGTSNSHQRVKPGDLLATDVVDPRAMPDKVRSALSAMARSSYQARVESLSLRELRDTLLPKLISGEIRVRDAERVVEDAT
jgi:type I restriction enzyme S subunit